MAKEVNMITTPKKVVNLSKCIFFIVFDFDVYIIGYHLLPGITIMMNFVEEKINTYLAGLHTVRIVSVASIFEKKYSRPI